MNTKTSLLPQKTPGTSEFDKTLLNSNGKFFPREPTILKESFPYKMRHAKKNKTQSKITETCHSPADTKEAPQGITGTLLGEISTLATILSFDMFRAPSMRAFRGPHSQTLILPFLLACLP